MACEQYIEDCQKMLDKLELAISPHGQAIFDDEYVTAYAKWSHYISLNIKLQDELNILGNKINSFNKAGLTNSTTELARQDYLIANIRLVRQEKQKQEDIKNALKAKYELEEYTNNPTASSLPYKYR